MSGSADHGGSVSGSADHGGSVTGRILTRRTRCQVRARPVLKGERRGSIQISGCGNEGEYLASAPVKGGIDPGHEIKTSECAGE